MDSGSGKQVGLNRRTGNFRLAAVIQFGSKYINVAVQMVITMVLARLLTPEEYGVMAVITVFVGLFSVVSNIGIGAAVIQYKELDHRDFESLFTFTLLLGIALTVLFVVIGFPLATFYGNDEYVSLMALASLSVLFQAANMVPNGLLIRNKMFLTNGVRLVVTSLIGGVASILLALAGWGVYALVLNTVLQSLLNLVWNIVASDIRRLNGSMKGPLAIVGRFAGFQFLSQVVQYLARNLDTVLVGAVFGSTSLGYYDKAYRLARYPIDIIPNTLNPVLKSFFASMEEDVERLYELYFKVEKVLSILGVFISVFCFFAAEELVFLFFGDQWGDSVPLFQALSVSIVFQMINFPSASVLEGVKRTDYLFGLIGISAGLLLFLLGVGLATGDVVVCAWMVSAGFVLYTPFVWLFVVRKALGKSIVEHIKNFIPEMVAAFATSAVLWTVSSLLKLDLIPSLAIKAIAAMAVYGIVICALGQTKYLKMIVGLRRGHARV